jgi:hypothetical protein
LVFTEGNSKFDPQTLSWESPNPSDYFSAILYETQPLPKSSTTSEFDEMLERLDFDKMLSQLL